MISVEDMLQSWDEEIGEDWNMIFDHVTEDQPGELLDCILISQAPDLTPKQVQELYRQRGAHLESLSKLDVASIERYNLLYRFNLLKPREVESIISARQLYTAKYLLSELLPLCVFPGKESVAQCRLSLLSKTQNNAPFPLVIDCDIDSLTARSTQVGLIIGFYYAVGLTYSILEANRTIFINQHRTGGYITSNWYYIEQAFQVQLPRDLLQVTLWFGTQLQALLGITALIVEEPYHPARRYHRYELTLFSPWAVIWDDARPVIQHAPLEISNEQCEDRQSKLFQIVPKLLRCYQRLK